MAQTGPGAAPRLAARITCSISAMDFQLGMTIDELHSITCIDRWFLFNIKQIVELEAELRAAGKNADHDLILKAKQYGFSDRQLGFIFGKEELAIRAMRESMGIRPVFKTVDTCAAEFAAETPYHYSTYETGERVETFGPEEGHHPRRRAEQDRTGN